MLGAVRLDECSNFQAKATQKPDGPYGNQHYSGELLMMGIVVAETCRAYKKYNNIIRSIQLVLILQLRVSVYVCVFMSVCVFVYIYIYVYMCVCVCV